MLAARLHKTHKELLESIDEEELYFWIAFHQIHNISPEREDALAALVAWSNAQPWSKERLKIENFLLKWDTETTNSKLALWQWRQQVQAQQQHTTILDKTAKGR